jgi:hypothetical protein
VSENVQLKIIQTATCPFNGVETQYFVLKEEHIVKDISRPEETVKIRAYPSMYKRLRLLIVRLTGSTQPREYKLRSYLIEK